jgi:uncharacterized protein
MTTETYESQRKLALTRRSADLGLRRAPGRPVWGVVMETAEKSGVTTIIATDDGAVSLLISAGASVQLTRNDWPSSAGSRLVGAAGDFLFECSPAWAYPLPESGMVRFYLLTFDGVMTTEAPARDLAQGKHPLSDLFYAGHDVHLLVRLVTEDPNWMSYKPVAGQIAAPGWATPSTIADSATDGLPATGRHAGAPSGAAAAPPGVSGSDLLVGAAAKNDVDEVARLLALGADCGANAKGITPLMTAAHAGAVEPLRLLLAAGVPVDVQDRHGYTALMLACNAGHEVCVRLLLGAGADVQARDGEGFTSMMFAAKSGYADIVRILIDRGADPATTSDRGLSAVGLATQKGHARIVAMLLGK